MSVSFETGGRSRGQVVGNVQNGSDVVERALHVGFERPRLVKIVYCLDVFKWPRALACCGTTCVCAR